MDAVEHLQEQIVEISGPLLAVFFEEEQRADILAVKQTGQVDPPATADQVADVCPHGPSAAQIMMPGQIPLEQMLTRQRHFLVTPPVEVVWSEQRH